MHAAAGTPMQTGSIEQLFRVNVDGVRHVVGSALALGVERIVCISSITAIFNPDASKVLQMRLREVKPTLWTE